MFKRREGETGGRRAKGGREGRGREEEISNDSSGEFLSVQAEVSMVVDCIAWTLPVAATMYLCEQPDSIERTF